MLLVIGLCALDVHVVGANKEWFLWFLWINNSVTEHYNKFANVHCFTQNKLYILTISISSHIKMHKIGENFLTNFTIFNNCDRICEKGPCPAFYQNWVIDTTRMRNLWRMEWYYWRANLMFRCEVITCKVWTIAETLFWARCVLFRNDCLPLISVYYT